MPAQPNISAPISPEELLRTSRDQFVKLNEKVRYLSVPPMAEEDLRHYVQDPFTALPPVVEWELPSVALVLVPYLAKRESSETVQVQFDAPALTEALPSYKLVEKDRVVLFFATKEEEVSEYHFSLYHLLAELMAERWTKDASAAFLDLVKQELAAKVNGEIDEKSWQMKQALGDRRAAKDTKALRDYAKQAFIDTATLYLHGICCDIDVETGPRQMPSRYVRKRLEALHLLYPPPAGHAVFPEELNKLRPPARARLQ